MQNFVIAIILFIVLGLLLISIIWNKFLLKRSRREQIAKKERGEEVREVLTAQRLVLSALLQSPAFPQLPEEHQKKVLSDSLTVVGYVVALGKFDTSVALGSEQIPQAERQSLLSSLDFPKYVAGLIKGVFDAVVDASIQQMNDYAELIESARKSVDQFKEDNISDDFARDYLLERYPNLLQKDAKTGQSIPKSEDSMAESSNFFEEFELCFKLSDLYGAEKEIALLEAVRQKILTERQQLLATTILMGLNRINGDDN